MSGFANPNATPATDDDPTQPTYNYDLDYDGPAVSNSRMGTGVINAAIAVGLGDGNTNGGFGQGG